MFSIGHDPDDLDRYAVLVFEVAAEGMLGVEELPDELLIYDGNQRRFRSVRKARVATREQRRSRGRQIPGRDFVAIGVKCGL